MLIFTLTIIENIKIIITHINFIWTIFVLFSGVHILINNLTNSCSFYVFPWLNFSNLYLKYSYMISYILLICISYLKFLLSTGNNDISKKINNKYIEIFFNIIHKIFSICIIYNISLLYNLTTFINLIFLICTISVLTKLVYLLSPSQYFNLITLPLVISVIM